MCAWRYQRRQQRAAVGDAGVTQRRARVQRWRAACRRRGRRSFLNWRRRADAGPTPARTSRNSTWRGCSLSLTSRTQAAARSKTVSVSTSRSCVYSSLAQRNQSVQRGACA